MERLDKLSETVIWHSRDGTGRFCRIVARATKINYCKPEIVLSSFPHAHSILRILNDCKWILWLVKFIVKSAFD